MLTIELSHTLPWSTTSSVIFGCLEDQPIPPQVDNNKPMVWQSTTDGIQLFLCPCGPASTWTMASLIKHMRNMMSQLLQYQIEEATISFPLPSDGSADEQLEQMIIQAQQSAYQLLSFKSIRKPYALKKLTLVVPNASEKKCLEGQHIAEAITLTRTLANLPANVCTPSYLATQAIALEEKYPSIKTTILDEEDLRTLKMNTFLAVSKGSIEPPRLIELHYTGTHANHQPVIFVGKGITFDSGGISLKPASGMEEMKYDMAGAASVLGTLQACAALELPINVIGLMACAENMPSGHATKPGDIITTFSGQTVEIINTDAEGRLVLADVLTYAEQFDPRFVLDIATLTGAMIVALGHEYTGFMTPNDMLAQLIESAAKKSLDKAWRLPLDEAYEASLESVLADFANARFDRKAGSITAAAFLSQFTKKFVWAHLDIAGTAWIPGAKNTATGRPVALLIQLLRTLCDAC